FCSAIVFPAVLRPSRQTLPTTAPTKAPDSLLFTSRYSRPSWCRLSFSIALTADDIHHGKDNDPYAIDEMPIPREHLDVLGVCARHKTANAQDQNHCEQDQTHEHVTGMQADQRVKGRPEQIRADREVISKDQFLPVQSGGAQEHHREDNSDQPPELESASV